MNDLVLENAEENQKQRGWKPGQSGNPKGKPIGARNRATIMAEKLLSKDIKKIVEVVNKAALEGDLVAARLVIERLMPVAKSRHVSFPMPPIRTVDDIAGALSSLWSAVSSGAISVDEMLALCAVLERHASIIHAQDHEKRLVALEASKTKQLEYRNAP